MNLTDEEKKHHERIGREADIAIAEMRVDRTYFNTCVHRARWKGKTQEFMSRYKRARRAGDTIREATRYAEWVLNV